MKFYSLYLNILNTNKRRLFISARGNPNLHVILLFKATSIHFTKVVNIHFVNWVSLTHFLITRISNFFLIFLNLFIK